MEDSYLPSPAQDLTNRRTISLTWSDKSSKNVKIGGTFNAWTPVDMERDPDGGWSFSMDLAVGEYQYKYFVEDEWRLDPTRLTVEDSGGNVNHVVHVGL
jgi:hypothetical protein